MRSYASLLLALILAGIWGIAIPAERMPSSSEREIAELESKWAECFHTGNPEAAKQFIADDFVGTSSKAVRYSKSEALKDIIESKGKYSSFTTKGIKVRVYGDAAVAQGTDVWEGSEKGSSVWTDTWVRIREKWQLVAAQDAQPEHPSK